MAQAPRRRYLGCHELQQLLAQGLHLLAGDGSLLFLFLLLPLLVPLPPAGLTSQLPVQGMFPAGTEPQGSRQEPDSTLTIWKLELQPAIGHQAAAVTIGVQGPAEQQEGLEERRQKTGSG